MEAPVPGRFVLNRFSVSRQNKRVSRRFARWVPSRPQLQPGGPSAAVLLWAPPGTGGGAIFPAGVRTGPEFCW